MKNYLLSMVITKLLHRHPYKHIILKIILIQYLNSQQGNYSHRILSCLIGNIWNLEKNKNKQTNNIDRNAKMGLKREYYCFSFKWILSWKWKSNSKTNFLGKNGTKIILQKFQVFHFFFLFLSHIYFFMLSWPNPIGYCHRKTYRMRS